MTERNRIIHADDTPQIRDLVRKFLMRKFPNFNFESFVDGTTLENRLKENPGNIGLVITDNEMPGVYGSQIIELYSKRPEFAEVPFILMYGGAKEIGMKALGDGAYAFFQKPVDIVDLGATCIQALGL